MSQKSRNQSTVFCYQSSAVLIKLFINSFDLTWFCVFCLISLLFSLLSGTFDTFLQLSIKPMSLKFAEWIISLIPFFRPLFFFFFFYFFFFFSRHQSMKPIVWVFVLDSFWAFFFIRLDPIHFQPNRIAVQKIPPSERRRDPFHLVNIVWLSW